MFIEGGRSSGRVFETVKEFFIGVEREEICNSIIVGRCVKYGGGYILEGGGVRR